MLLNYPCPAMIKIHIPRTLLLSLFSLLALNGFSNNIQVSNVALLGRNTSAGTNNAANFTQVQFNLSWENSWRVSVGPSNWDAAWVFVKFQVGASNPVLNSVNSSGTTITVGTTANLRVGMPVRVTSGTGAFASNTVISSITSATQFVVSATPTNVLINASIECIRIWEHAWLNNTGHTAPSGSTLNVGLVSPGTPFNASTNPALGAFVYRSTTGSGNNIFNSIALRWNYGSNSVRDDALVNVQVFAIEMVYVPGNVSFNVGGGGGKYAFVSKNITNSSVFALDYFLSDGTTTSFYNTNPAVGWPNGYNAFYCMKYEISQGQYRDFLNTLTRTQQNNRVATSITVGTTTVTNRYVMTNSTTLTNRNGIRCSSPVNANNPINFYCDLNGNGIANEDADGEWLACNFLSWMDGAAYTDWAGLRPMTEMEFEKACRGNQAAVIGEYAWGTNGIASTAYTLSNIGSINESIATNYSTTAGNSSYLTTDGSIDGPLRVGIFANSSSTRIQSGGSYYGIMELSGNVEERVVVIHNVAGRSFTGLHGNGMVTAEGHGNVSFWPGINGNGSSSIQNTEVIGTNGITEAAGSGFRGGSWSNTELYARVSDREDALITRAGRLNDYGFRAVRTAQ